ncbi:MAG: class I SAM-dependent methyltransferase [Arthrobacter sp.]
MNSRIKAIALAVILLGAASAVSAFLDVVQIALGILSVIVTAGFVLALSNRALLGDTRTVQRETLKALRGLEQRTNEQADRLRDQVAAQGVERLTESQRVLGRIGFLSRQLNEQSLRYVAMGDALVSLNARIEVGLVPMQDVVNTVKGSAGISDASCERLASAIAELAAEVDRDAERSLALLHESASNMQDIAVAVTDIREGEHSQSLRKKLVTDVASLLALYGKDKDLYAGVPERWAAPPRVLLELIKHILACKHAPTVVEFGSGVSTFWMAWAIQQRGSGRLISFEHLPEYAEKTNDLLASAGLSAYVDLRVGALAEQTFDGFSGAWYQGWEDIERADVLFVDGPPQATGKTARTPAAFAFSSKLSAGAVICLDDAYRADEELSVKAWKDMSFPRGDLEELTRVDRAAFFRLQARVSD